jgi:DNA-binding transcriptional ArsR family regulator
VTGPAPSLEELGRVLAEPTRLRMLQELLGGTALPAGALAARVGVAPSTASAHLARLRAAGLIELHRHGRSHRAVLARPEVAEAVEALLRLAGAGPAPLPAAGGRTALRTARSCYDHLAGLLGVGLAGLAIDEGWVLVRDGIWTVAPGGLEACSAALGLAVRPNGAPSRPLVRGCPDWTERRPHLAGRFGAALLTSVLEAGWVRRRPRDRALGVTAPGRAALARLGVDLDGPAVVRESSGDLSDVPDLTAARSPRHPAQARP